MIRLRQVCIAAPRITAANDFAELFDVPIVYRDPLIIEFGLENALLGFGGTFVEFIAPVKDGTTATRFLAKHPNGGGYMVIHDTDDYDTIRARVDEYGVQVAYESTPEIRGPEKNLPEYGYDSFKHLQLHPRSVGGTLMEFSQTADNEDLFGGYAPAGLNWQEQVRGRDLPKIVATECTSTDHRAMAETWAALMDKPTEAEGDDLLIRLDGGGVDRFAHGESNAFTKLFISSSDPDAHLGRARAAGLETDGNEFDFCGVRVAVVPD